MYKCLTVVAFSLLVLTGAMGLRNVAVTHASTITSSSFSIQGRPFPPPGGGRFLVQAIPSQGVGQLQGRPFPPPGGGRLQGRPFPPPGGGRMQGRPFPPPGGGR